MVRLKGIVYLTSNSQFNKQFYCDSDIKYIIIQSLRKEVDISQSSISFIVFE